MCIFEPGINSLSRSLLPLFFNFFQLEFTWPNSYASKSGHGIPLYPIFPCDTFLRSFSFYNFLKSFIFFRYRNVYSFHLLHLFRSTSLFMEDTNFVILNIQILIRSNFSEVFQGRHCIADITKSVLLVLSQSVERKNGSGWKISNSYFETVSNVKGYHVYQSIWVPKIGKIFSTAREPGNPKDKYAVCVKKS